MLRRSACPPLLCLLLLACTNTIEAPSAGAGGGGVNAASSGGGDAASCTIDEPGETFEIRIRNVGSDAIYLDRGKVGTTSTWPIAIVAPATGTIHNNAWCGNSCDRVYDGNYQPGCMFGLNHGSIVVDPGATTTIEWDRRLFQDHKAPLSCSGLDEEVDCAMPVRVDDDAIIDAVLTICSQGIGDGCPAGSDIDFPFTLDLTESAITIDVQAP